MGEVRVVARAGTPKQGLREVEFLVDTGAFYTYPPLGTCDELGIDSLVPHRARTADNRPIDLRLGLALLEIDGRSAGIVVTEMNVPVPLLGVSALEALGFKLNPIGGTLEPPPSIPRNTDSLG